ncbi:MAG TPA: hypothetical protein VGN41_20165 [Streptosporangiaceae bacterium]
MTSTAIDAVARPLAIAPAPARTRVPLRSGHDRTLRGTAAVTPSRGAAL